MGSADQGPEGTPQDLAEFLDGMKDALNKLGAKRGKRATLEALGLFVAAVTAAQAKGDLGKALELLGPVIDEILGGVKRYCSAGQGERADLKRANDADL